MVFHWQLCLRLGSIASSWSAIWLVINQLAFVKPISKQSFCLITNRHKLIAQKSQWTIQNSRRIKCSWREALDSVCQRVMIGLILVNFDWMTKSKIYSSGGYILLSSASWFKTKVNANYFLKPREYCPVWHEFLNQSQDALSKTKAISEYILFLTLS